MTIRDQVRAFLRKRSPRAICDACIGDHLGFGRRQICRAACYLADLEGFRRKTDLCAGCCARGRVTWAV